MTQPEHGPDPSDSHARHLIEPVDSLLDLDATAQAEAIRARHVSPVELVNAALSRNAERNPALNAVIHLRSEQALAEAQALPLDSSAPFIGVPIVVKDLGLGIAGEPHYMGTRGLKRHGYNAPVNSYSYDKLRAAGFVVIGRTNTPEFGTTITTEPLSYGPSRNPWNTNHSTGGSSGGSAAAVSAGIVAVGHANDGGGSIRIPASECGLVGLKPTRGRVSHGPLVGESWFGSTIDGAVTRSVRDAAAVLWAMQGPMPGDPYAAPTPLRPYTDEVGADPGKLKIGLFCDAQTGFAVAPECVEAVKRAGTMLETLGHHVEFSVPPALLDAEFGDHFVTGMMANVAADVAYFETLFGHEFGEDDLEPENLFYAMVGKTLSATTYLNALAWLHDYRVRMASWWTPNGGNGFDLLVTPTIGVAPPPIGWISDPSAEPGHRVRSVMQYTAQFNVTGQPGISLPLQVNGDGLPIGVQIVAAFGREDLLIRVASQLEATHPWPHLAPAYR
jgi:amidase